MKKRVLWANWVGRKIGVELLFEPRDLWVGVFWDKQGPNRWNERRWVVYVCAVPCLPLRFSWHAATLPLHTRLRLRFTERG